MTQQISLSPKKPIQRKRKEKRIKNIIKLKQKELKKKHNKLKQKMFIFSIIL